MPAVGEIVPISRWLAEIREQSPFWRHHWVATARRYGAAVLLPSEALKM